MDKLSQWTEATIPQQVTPLIRPVREPIDLLVDGIMGQLDRWLGSGQNGSSWPTFSEAEWQALRDQFYRLWKLAFASTDEATAQSLMVLMDGAEFTLREYVTPRLLEVLREGLWQFRTRGYFAPDDVHFWHKAIWRAGGRVIGPVSDIAALHDEG
jgi:hypothetical protein